MLTVDIRTERVNTALVHLAAWGDTCQLQIACNKCFARRLSSNLVSLPAFQYVISMQDLVWCYNICMDMLQYSWLFTLYNTFHAVCQCIYVILDNRSSASLIPEPVAQLEYLLSPFPGNMSGSEQQETPKVTELPTNTLEAISSTHVCTASNIFVNNHNYVREYLYINIDN